MKPTQPAMSRTPTSKMGTRRHGLQRVVVMMAVVACTLSTTTAFTTPMAPPSYPQSPSPAHFVSRSRASSSGAVRTTTTTNLAAAYKPPVKSSVGKAFTNSRSSPSSSTPSSSDKTTAKQAVASSSSVFGRQRSRPLLRVKHFVYSLWTKQQELRRRAVMTVVNSFAAVQEEPATLTAATTTITAKGNVYIVETLDEFQQVVLGGSSSAGGAASAASMQANEDDELVAVLFQAPWCRACKAATPKFIQLANRYSQQRRRRGTGSAKFVQVPVSQDNMPFLKALGVEKFPMYHIYHPTRGLVSEGPFLRNVVDEFETNLKSHLLP